VKAVLLVFLGGGLGSVARYAIGKWVGTFYSQLFPLGTLVANVLACLVLGFIIGLADTRQLLSPNAKILWTIGFCGGFSTFSTFSNETLTLFQGGYTLSGLIYIGLSLVLCISAAMGGIYLGAR